MNKTFFTFAEFQKMSPEDRGANMAKMLSQFINGAGETEKQAFAKTVLQDHRTLQQETFDLFLRLCEQWAELQENWYDLRNEYTVKKSKEIVQLMEGLMRAPFI